MDVALASLCWSVVIAAHYRITMLTVEPLIVICSMIWAAVIYARLQAISRHEENAVGAYYRCHLMPLAPISLAVLLAGLWVLFFHVGQGLLHFLTVPILFVVFSRLLQRKFRKIAMLLVSMAFVFMCAAPVYFYSFRFTPLGMLLSTQLWLLIGVFFLFNLERARDNRDKNLAYAVFRTVVLLLIFLICCAKLLTVPSEIRGLYVTICISVACFYELCRLRKQLSDDKWHAISWGLMALPALLSIIVFAPEEW